MKTLILALSLAAAGFTLPAVAQHDHGTHAAPPNAAPVQQVERSGGRGGMREWTKQPLLLGRAERGARSGAVLTPRGLTATSVTVYAADGPAERRKVEYPVAPEGARIESVAPRIGNYHWVVAREESADTVRVASTAWYFGEPGDSPKDMLDVPKHELEIVPMPLPREHRSYREAEKWRFLARFNGQPLPNQPVTMETEFGSRSTAFTDASGIATVVFPRDFKPVPPAEGETAGSRQRGRFVLATEKEANGRRYLTAFNYVYTPDTERNRSIGWGAAFGVIGMLAATPLLRRRNGAPGENQHA